MRSFNTLSSGLNRIAIYKNPGLVVLVCPGPLLHAWLQPQIDSLQLLIPELCPILATDETARYIDEVNVDIMISDHPIQQAGLMEQPLLKDEWVVIVAAKVAAQLKDIPQADHHLHVDMLCLEKT